MKPEEAIVWIEDTRYIYENMNPNIELSKLKCEAFNLAIQALEKQIPTKPEMYIGDYEFERWPICPKCKGELHPNGEKFCSDCGQAIDWSDEP